MENAILEPASITLCWRMSWLGNSVTTSLCIAANVPQATGLRWLSALEKADLLYRTSAPDDARLRLVEITAQGHKLMRRFIADSVTRFEMPLPD